MSRAPSRSDDVFVVLLAGGQGVRFWPLSRLSRPKPFLDPLGHGPLLQATRDRVAELCPPSQLLAVTSREHARLTGSTLGLPPSNVLAEPTRKNTAAAIGLALLVASCRDPDAVVLALPTDHHVARPARLRQVLRRGIRAARSLRGAVVFGAVPDRPETGYGYVSPGPAVALRGAAGLRRVRRFREKPTRRTALRLVRQGAWWNTGMFCLHAASVLAAIDRSLPELGAALSALRTHVDRPSWGRALARIQPAMPSISFDRGVVERLEELHVLPADVGWSDVGSWESLGELLPSDRRGNRALGRALFEGSSGCLAIQGDGAAGRAVVVVGADDLVIVDAGDVVCAFPRGRERDMGALLERIRRELPELR